MQVYNCAERIGSLCLKEVVFLGRTNIVVDDELLRIVMDLTGARTKREAVHLALRQMAETLLASERLRQLRGRLPWQGDLERWRRDRTDRTGDARQPS